jgi:hypothetical protein
LGNVATSNIKLYEDDIKMYLKEIVDGTGSRSCTVVDFGFSSVKPLGSITKELFIA